MNLETTKGKVTAVVVTGAAVLLLAGCTKNEESGSTDTSSNASPAVAASTDTKAADLRNVLNTLEHDHVALAFNATTDAVDGAPSGPASLAALQANSVEITKGITSVYGDAAGQEFKQIFDSHLGFFANFATAQRTNDAAAEAKARADMDGYEQAIGNFFGKANPNLKAETVTQLFNEHADIIFQGIQAHDAKDFKKEYVQEDLAAKQITKIADATAAAIVKQKPEMFTGSAQTSAQ